MISIDFIWYHLASICFDCVMRLYRDLPCLHRQDDRADGFHWLEAFPASGLGSLSIFLEPFFDQI